MIAFFLAISLFIVLAGHGLLLYFIIHYFSVTSAPLQGLIASGLFLFAMSFIYSVLLAHWFNNSLTRFYYILSGIWLGFATNLFMAVILCLATEYVLNFFGYDPNLTLMGGITVALAIGYSIYGVTNACSIRIRKIDLPLNNFPASWLNKTIVQISDVHLGSALNNHYTRKIVDLVNGIHPDIVFITGDLFDDISFNLEELVEPFNSLNPPMGSFFITGNHETYLGAKNSLKALASTPIKSLMDEMAIINGVQVLGMRYPAPGHSKKLIESIKAIPGFNSQLPTILLYHEPIEIKETSELGIALYLSGHTHKGQLFPFNYLTNLVYKGWDFGLRQIGSTFINISSGTGVWGPAMRTSGRSEIVEIKIKPA